MLTVEQQHLCERYVPLADGIARRKHLSFEHWDDTRSDALMGLVRAAHGYRPPSPFGPYARKFIEGAIQQGRRDRSGIRSGQVYMPPKWVPLDGIDPPAPVADDSFDAGELWDLVDQLPDSEAAVVRLYYVQDLPQTEIGVMLGISQMHVSRLLVQARTRLKERIGS